MKIKLTVLTLTALLVLGGFSAIAQAQEEAVNVGNKICPITGQKVGSMGGSVQVEHEGKIYNVCCGMCVRVFKDDPQSAIQKINEELEGLEAPEEFDIHAGHNH